jgi:hypothetical protein
MKNANLIRQSVAEDSQPSYRRPAVHTTEVLRALQAHGARADGRRCHPASLALRYTWPVEYYFK